MKNNIIEKLEISRQELLDIGLRGNSLLHFKPRAHSLTILDEVSAEVYSIIYEKQKQMSFLPIPKELQNKDKNVANVEVELPRILEEKAGKKRHSDSKLQTKLNQDNLDKKLIKINTEAETFYKEQGIDILYLALGFLSWYENENSDLERKAPIVLIPVSLNRSTAQERFKLKYTQVDLSTNLTLAAKLKSDFAIELPEFNDEIGLEQYFKKVSSVIKKHERWSVIENEIHLGFFKFGRFQMYQDLDAKSWPKEKKPFNHPILKALFGDGFFTEEEARELDNEKFENENLSKLEQFHFIADADSSQAEAVIKIKKGDNLVIQGPPGTGKSQTITNIIAESLADNKKILFVSEKMVALEVVMRRLTQSHLGEAVLELHSHKSNKKSVLNELKKTLELGKPEINSRDLQFQRYKELKTKLDSYAEAVKQPILNSKISFVKAVGLMYHYKSKLLENNIEETHQKNLEKWGEKKFRDSILLLNDTVAHLQENGIPSKNYFSLANIKSFSPSDKDFIEKKLSDVLINFQILKDEVLKVCEHLNLSSPSSLTEINQMISFLEMIKDIPKLTSTDVKNENWLESEVIIKEYIQAGQKQNLLKKEYENIIVDAGFKSDVLALRQTFITKGVKWWRFLSPEYNRAKNKLKGLLKNELPKNSVCVEIIDAILEYQKLEDKLNNGDSLMSSLFSVQWQKHDSNWNKLAEIHNWLSELYKKIANEEIKPEVINVIQQRSLENSPDFQLKKIYSLITKNFDQLNSKLEITDDKWLTSLDLDNLINIVSNQLNNSDQIFKIAAYNRLKESLDKNKLSVFSELSFNWSYSPNLLVDLFKFMYYKSLVDYAYEAREPIKYFDSVNHAKDILEFKRLDAQLSQFSQEKLTLKHYNNLPSVLAPGEMALIRREVNKKTRHIPLRQLLDKAGNAIQQIKPVFMMSPMSVATFLKQGRLEFDLVIFDEASQVKVVDALIPILRGKQIVVVGDSKQMPPTNFFNKTFESDEDEDLNVTGDIESILGMFLAKGARESMLKWHYRSRHDSLINVSNQEFYEGKLMVFPSSGTNELAKGLSFTLINESVYERGSSRTNPIEARKVAETVMKHASDFPSITLGVVAFSTAQRDCIILELERLRRLNPDNESFFSSENEEEFFVKNLENVQGDERDKIIISIGYGKTAEGRLTSNFGPLNREGGERRLNVLITRSRLSMEVFCNFTSDDMNTKSSSPIGLKSLKSFLKYAETGEFLRSHETGKETDSPFEDEVIKVVERLGYQVEPQVGSAGFFIDIAVKDPNKPGKYMLAIECDGASYHSSVSARDRDRLRQNVLEAMGWRFHRIWSTDWFRTPKKQIEKLKEVLVLAEKLSKQDFEATVSNDSSEKHIIVRSENTIEEPKKNEYNIFETVSGISYDIHETPTFKLVKELSKIVNHEGPLHLKDAAKRIVDSVGVTRIGSRIYNEIIYAAKEGHKKGLFFYEKEFLYRDSNKKVEVRDRSNLEPRFKEIENVSPIEIRNAIIETIQMAFSITEENMISESLRLMGFGRATTKASNVILKQINYLKIKGMIKKDGDKYIIKN